MRAHFTNPPTDVVDEEDVTAHRLLASFRLLADVFRELLSEESLDTLLARVADSLKELVPYDTLTIYEADPTGMVLTPVLARDQWADEIMKTQVEVGRGMTGWAVARREVLYSPNAHLDPRRIVVPGTPEDDPEALISVPLVARGSLRGALNVYRLGEDAEFSESEIELARRFGDAAALALENARTRAYLEQQATTDALTGVANRRAFRERLEAEVGRTARTRAPVSLVLLDIDDFKAVNDDYGHPAGDRALADFALQLKNSVRELDLVARLGGEEFAVIVPDSGATEAVSLSERIREAVREIALFPKLRLCVSAGVAEAPAQAVTADEL